MIGISQILLSKKGTNANITPAIANMRSNSGTMIIINVLPAIRVIRNAVPAKRQLKKNISVFMSVLPISHRSGHLPYEIECVTE